MSQKKFRNSCMATFEEPNPDLTKIDFICWQEEKCPTTGKNHYQVYVEFKDSYKLKDCQKYIGIENCHIEKRLTPHRYIAMLYCKNNEHWEEAQKGNKHIDKKKAKDKTGYYTIGSYKQFGKEPKRENDKGKRTDVEELKKLIDNGASYEKIADELPNMILKYSKGVKELIATRNKKNSKGFRKIETNIFWGNAESGKTKEVFELEGEENVYKLDKANNGNTWFDGYEGQKVLLIDDFYGEIKFSELLNILDGYQLKLQIKTCHDWALWEKVYITSNKPYEKWYKKDEKDLEPLTRRINNIVEINRKTEMRKPERLTLEQLKEKRKKLNEKLNENNK